MNLALWLARSAQQSPEAPAIMVGTRVHSTYREWARDAAAIGAALLKKHGIAPGDRVGLFLPNCSNYLQLLYGAWFAGAAVVPVNAKLHPQEVGWILADAGVKLLFTTAEQAHALSSSGTDYSSRILTLGSHELDVLSDGEELAGPAERNPNDLAWLFYTSGTTGKPKGAMLSFGNLAAMTHSYFVDVDEVRTEDAVLYAAPLSHGAGLYNFMHVLRGARHVIPESGGFDAAEIFALARELGSVSMFAAPTMVRHLVETASQSGQDGEGLRTIVYGGGPMYLADIEQAVARMGTRFVQIYGQGESPMTITALPRALVADRSHPQWRERLGSVGFAQSVVEVRVADPTGRTVPPGEVLVRGATVMLGYWNNPEASAEAIRDGWLWTGDIGSMDEKGFLTLKDRSKDLIISGGCNIYPREIEEILLRHPRLSEAAVIGRADDKWGEVAVAYVVGDASAQELDQLCLRQLARFKRPKEYVFVPSLPKNNYGKILKTELREQDRARRSAQLI